MLRRRLLPLLIGLLLWELYYAYLGWKTAPVPALTPAPAPVSTPAQPDHPAADALPFSPPNGPASG